MPVFSTNWKFLAQCYVRYFCKNYARIEKLVAVSIKLFSKWLTPLWSAITRVEPVERNQANDEPSSILLACLKPGIYRSPWRDFPDVVIQTTVTKLRSRPGYDQAKRGEGETAHHVVQELIKPEKIPFEIDIIVPVMQFDRDKPIRTYWASQCSSERSSPAAGS